MTDAAEKIETEFQYLDRRVEECLLEDRIVVKVPEGATLHGFAVPQERAHSEAREKALVERYAQLSVYRNDAQKLHKTLRTCGVEPLAVITRAAWNGIIKRCDLYVISPTATGVIYMPTELAGKARAEAERRSLRDWVFPGAVVLASALGLYGLHEYVTSAEWDSSSRVFVALALTFFGVTVPLAVGLAWLDARIKRRLLSGIVGRWARGSWAEFLRAVAISGPWWHPESRTYGGRDVNVVGQSADGVARMIRLPRPPDALIDKIERVRHKFQISVALVPEALQIEGGVRGYFETSFHEMEQREEALRRDPIVFIAHGSAVAVIEHYGESVIERAAIDAVLASGHLL